MDIGDLPELASGFVSLLLLPTLGVIGLMHRRAIPVLAWTLAAWAIVGGLLLWTRHTLVWDRREFTRGWMVGLGLGAAFLAVARLHADKRVKPWIRVVLTLLTVVVFVRSLVEYLERYV